MFIKVCRLSVSAALKLLAIFSGYLLRRLFLSFVTGITLFAILGIIRLLFSYAKTVFLFSRSLVFTLGWLGGPLEKNRFLKASLLSDSSFMAFMSLKKPFSLLSFLLFYWYLSNICLLYSSTGSEGWPMLAKHTVDEEVAEHHFILIAASSSEVAVLLEPLSDDFSPVPVNIVDAALKQVNPSLFRPVLLCRPRCLACLRRSSASHACVCP